MAIFLAVLFGFLAHQSVEGAVGYYNRSLVVGDNLVANQLNASPDNTLNNILISTVADGATFTKWDPLANMFLPLSTYDDLTHTWSINYTLNLGEGGLLHSPAATVATFVGEVGPYLNSSPPPRQTGWVPNYADGFYLISCPSPFGDATFEEVVGRAPGAGEWVSILNEATQLYSVTVFDGASWDNGAPMLTVGQAAWFNLGPVIVPEPSFLALLVVGGVAALFRRRSRNSPI